jgi:hypothetical protein
MIDRSFFASFPRTPVEKGLRLLHTPSEWGNGVCLAFGVNRFQTRNFTSCVTLHKEKMQQFYMGDTPVTFIAQGDKKVILRTPYDIDVNIRMNEYSDTMGFSFYVTVSGLPDVSDKEKYTWSKAYRSLMEAMLFSLST